MCEPHIEQLFAVLHESEVEHLGKVVFEPVTTQEQVRRLQITMHELDFVSLGQRVTDLA